MSLSRRKLLRRAAAAAAALALPPLDSMAEWGRHRGPANNLPRDPSEEDLHRLLEWTTGVRTAGLAGTGAAPGPAAARVGEQAVGTPYEAHTLEAYIRAGGDPSAREPLTVSLTRFDCVSLVESCLAIARLAGSQGDPTWADLGDEIERLRYRGGVREGYPSRLHYFSEWIRDNAARGSLRDMGRELGGDADTRPLRFMTRHRDAYPALANDNVYAAIGAMERRQDAHPRWVIPSDGIPAISDRIRTGDVLAFATAIQGLDVTHSAFAYRDEAGVLRVLHAPLSGGEVEVTGSTLPEYVAAIRSATGILIARPLPRTQ